EPAVTPPPPNTGTSFLKKPKLSSAKSKKKEIPEGLWVKCPKCSTMLYDKELDENLKVCQHCQHHFPIGARERIHSLVEPCSFQEMDAEMSSVDVLQFPSYPDILEKNYRKATGARDAVITGVGKIGAYKT